MRAVRQAGPAVPVTGPARRPDERRTTLRTLYYLAVGALAALVPLVLFAGLWLRSELATSQQALESFLNDRVRALSQAVDAEMREQLSLLSAIAALPSLDSPDIPTFRAEAERLVTAGARWRALVLVAPDGRVVADPVPSGAGGAAPTIMPDAARLAAENRRAVIRVTGGEGGEAQAMLHMPVLRADAPPLVLVAVTPAAAIQRVMMQGASPDLLAVLLDETGRVLAHSREPSLIGRAANPGLRQAIDGHVEGVFGARTLDGQEVFTGFQRSRLTGWVAVSALDRGRYTALSKRSTYATTVTGLMSLLIAAVLAIVLSYNVVQRRVNEERLAASRALGDLDARLLAATQDALAEQRKAATEREVLLREIYHRVKNNLQIVQSLLRLGARDLLPEQQEPFEAAVRRIGAMARVHTLLYNSPDLASLDLRDYLDDLVQEVATSYGAEERGIAVRLEVESMRVPLDTAVPLAFIAVELLTNAFRHAFPDDRAGTVTVRAGAQDGRGVLEVGDDGVGMPEPVPGARRRSLGLTIVRQLARQIEGELTLPEPGASTTRVTFPLEAKPAPPLPGVG